MIFSKSSVSRALFYFNKFAEATFLSLFSKIFSKDFELWSDILE